MLGIIGGSGLYDLPGLDITDRMVVDTPFGQPSDRLVMGKLDGTPVVFLPRHGSGHAHNPSDLPYRANIYALKQVGVTHLVSFNAVGSLKEELPPRAFVQPDQIIDRTVSRERTFFDEGVVAHVGVAEPFCGSLRSHIGAVGAGIDIDIVDGGTYLCIEGPQFSTKAESHLFRSWGCSVIGMTAMPEARLAREAELCYAAVAMVTDYDVWHETEGPVTVEMVGGHLRANSARAAALVAALVQHPLSDRSCGCRDALRNAIITNRTHISLAQRTRLGVIAERYLADG